MTLENWRPVPGYEGLYEASDHGRVRSLDRIDSRGNRALGRVLLPDVRPSGHLRVSLCRNGRVKRMWVHRLVLSIFVGPCPDGLEGCHDDGDPANNAVDNLRWDTKSANARDRQRHGTDRQTRKTHCPQRHEYSTENTYFSAEGHRHCRACTLAVQRENKESINASRRKRYASRKVA